MRRAALIALLPATFAASFAFGWTQNTQSDWLKGIIYAGSGKKQLTDSTGNLVASGSGTITGNVAIGGTLAVTGATTLRSTLAVTGAETIGGACAVTGALSTASTLSVTGTSTLTGVVTTTSDLAIGGTGTIAGNETVGGALGVVGAATVTGATTLKSTLAVTGASTLTGNVAMAGTLAVTGTTSLVGAVTFSTNPVFASAETGLTAHSGGGQASALALSSTKFIHVVSTVGTAADSVVLPAPVLGTCHQVANEAAANAMQIFAVGPATINGAATGTGVSLSAKKGTFCCASSSTDYACTGPN